MNFNFNDPAGVQALLDQIKSSSAWQELSAASTVPPEQASLPGEAPTTKQHSTESPPGHSVAALLSQLQSPQEAWKSPANGTTDPTSHSTSLEPAQSQPPYTELTGSHSAISEKDVHSLDFDESLPLLLRLSRDPSFVNEMRKIKQDQDALERQLWEERRSIHKKYEDKLKAAKIKASIIGASVSKHEAETLADAHDKELRKFDRDRASAAWESLVAQQQAKLRRLQIPTMFVTSDPSTLQLQQRVLQVLSSIIGPSIK